MKLYTVVGYRDYAGGKEQEPFFRHVEAIGMGAAIEHCLKELSAESRKANEEGCEIDYIQIVQIFEGHHEGLLPEGEWLRKYPGCGIGQ